MNAFCVRAAAHRARHIGGILTSTLVQRYLCRFAATFLIINRILKAIFICLK